MNCRSLILSACCAPLWLSCAAESLRLTGIIELGDLRRVLVTELPSNHAYILSPNRNTAGLRLLDIDMQTGKVRIQRGGEVIELVFAAPAVSAFPMEPAPAGAEPELIRLHRAGLLQTGTTPALSETRPPSIRDVQLLRRYAKSLPEYERAPFLAEIQSQLEAIDRTARPAPAGPEAGANPGATAQAGHTGLIDPDPDRPRSALEYVPKWTLDSAPAQAEQSARLQHLLATPPPAVGSLSGTAQEDILPLRILLRNQTDPGIRRRILQQIYGYFSSPIEGNYLEYD
jgi:hypothetical protein